MGQDIEDSFTENIALLAASYEVSYDDLHSLASFVRNCVFSSEWGSEDEVVRALSDLGIDWKMDEESIIKYRVFGYLNDEYPIRGTDVLTREGRVGGILVMNVIHDVGGKEIANEVSNNLFGKPCSVGLSRDQLKQIHESVIENG